MQWSVSQLLFKPQGQGCTDRNNINFVPDCVKQAVKGVNLKNGNQVVCQDETKKQRLKKLKCNEETPKQPIAQLEVAAEDSRH